MKAAARRTTRSGGSARRTRAEKPRPAAKGPPGRGNERPPWHALRRLRQAHAQQQEDPESASAGFVEGHPNSPLMAPAFEVGRAHLGARKQLPSRPRERDGAVHHHVGRGRASRSAWKAFCSTRNTVRPSRALRSAMTSEDLLDDQAARARAKAHPAAGA